MERRLRDIYDHENYRALLREDFFLRSEKNPQYSLRSYASDLKLSPSVLSMVLQNKRHLSEQKIRQTATLIGLVDPEQDYLVALYKKERFRNSKKSLEAEYLYRQHRPAVAHQQLEKEEAKMLCRSLLHVLVLNCFDFPRLRRQPEQIDQLLGITADRRQQIITELLAAELLYEDAEHGLVAKEQLILGDNNTEELLQHVLELKDLSKHLVQKYQRVVDRENSISIFYHIATNAQEQPKIVDAIKRFQHEILKLHESCKNPDRYYLASVDMQKLWQLAGEESEPTIPTSLSTPQK